MKANNEIIKIHSTFNRIRRDYDWWHHLYPYECDNNTINQRVERLISCFKDFEKNIDKLANDKLTEQINVQSSEANTCTQNIASGSSDKQDIPEDDNCVTRFSIEQW